MNDVVLTKENSMLEKAFENADIALSKSYLSNLTNGEVLSIKTNSNDVNSVVRFFSIGQIITNKSENMRDKLSNVFHSVWNANGSILLLIKGKKDSTEIYMGIKNVLFDDSDDGINHTTLLSEILENNLKAKAIANEIAKVFSKEIESIYEIKNLSIIDYADENTIPYNINVPKQMVISVLVSFVLACGIIFVMFYFDTTIKSSEEIEEKIGLPVLGVVPFKPNLKGGNK